jgi:hypothetical protein
MAWLSSARVRIALIRYLAPLAVLLLFAIFFFGFYSWTIDFPISYHPDEPSKVDQIFAGKRNFNHPQLMLTVTDLARRVLSPEGNSEFILSLGRRVSAASGALAVACSMLLGYSHRRWAGLLICGFLVGFCPTLFTYSHFFKEDAALLGAMSLCLVSVRFMVICPHRPRLVLISVLLVGVGVGLCASAKYVGLAAIPPAILACCLAQGGSWRGCVVRFLIMGTAAIATFIMANASAFESFVPPRWSFEASQKFLSEVRHGVTGEKGLALPVPNLFLAWESIKAIMPHLLIFGIVALAMRVREQKVSRTVVAYLVFLASFTLVLAFNSIPFARYAVPLIFILSLLGGLSIADLFDRVWSTRESRLRGLALAILALLITIQLFQCLQIEGQFRKDSRQFLREWVAANVPVECVMVADAYTNLGSADGDKSRFPKVSRLPMVVKTKQFASDHSDSLEDMRNSGVCFVAVCSLTYDRLYARGVYGRDGSNELWSSRKQFYDELFTRGRLVWQSVPEPQMHGFVSPELRVYDIREPK